MPGEGSPSPSLVIVGEAPGAEEAKTGRPFVGKAGQLLDRTLEASGLNRKEIFITNVLKCRPPGNREPQQDECEACEGWLAAQIEALSPRVVLTLGRVAFEVLSGRKATMKRVRGHLFNLGTTELFPTFHPAYALRNPQGLRALQEDISALAGWLVAQED